MAKLLHQKDNTGTAVEVTKGNLYVSASETPTGRVDGFIVRTERDGSVRTEIEAVEPPKHILPVTETGYRSHFIARGVVEQAGGPAAYARAWLDHAAKAPAWKRQQEASRQLCLF